VTLLIARWTVAVSTAESGFSSVFCVTWDNGAAEVEVDTSAEIYLNQLSPGIRQD
jgi:hypothetical protein